MPSKTAVVLSGTGRAPQDVRARLDDVDRTLLHLLAADARMSNKDLAERAGIAASTCLSRVRALRRSGVIRGFHADIDPRALGHDLEAMIAIRLQPDARGTLRDVVAELAARPEVLDVYFVAGADDFLLHVATADTAALRGFVADRLNRDPAIAGTETSLIFEHTRAAGRLGAHRPPITSPPITSPPITSPPITSPPITAPPAGSQNGGGSSPSSG